MALKGFAGAETGGLEELITTFGAPAVVSSPARSGSYCYELSSGGTPDAFLLAGVDGPLNNNCVGLGFRWTGSWSTSFADLIMIVDSTPTNHLRIRIDATNIYIIDSTPTIQATIAHGFVADTWYYIEMYHAYAADAGTVTVKVNGVTIADAIAGDYGAGPTGFGLRVTGAISGGPTIYVDDVYWALGNEAVTDLFGPSEVLAYQSGNTTATSDAGSNLNTGVWNNTGKTPLETVTTRASLTASGVTAYVHFDDAANGGRGPGPSGGAYTLNGTIRDAKGVFRLFRGGGGGTSHSASVGNNVDGVAGATVALTTSPQTFQLLFSAVGGAGAVPTASEVFALGFGTSGAQDILCDEMWAMLLHTPPSTKAPPPHTQLRYQRRAYNMRRRIAA